MPRVAVVTDSTSYLPADVVEANQITVVSLYVNFGGGRTDRELDITDYDKFFHEMRTAETLPTTSQPSVGDFMAAYEPLLAGGADIVSFHISGGISGTHESARQAAEQLEREMVPIERVRTSKRAFERLAHYAQQRKDDGADGWVVQHVHAQEQADAMVERCKEIFGRDPVFVSEVGPVLAAHTGPGLLGVGGIPARHLE